MIASLLGVAAPGFDRPLEVLEACHARIAKQCDTLDKLLMHLSRTVLTRRRNRPHARCWRTSTRQP